MLAPELGHSKIGICLALLGSVVCCARLCAESKQQSTRSPEIRSRSVRPGAADSTRNDIRSKIHPRLLDRLNEANAKPVKAWVLLADKGIVDEQEYRSALRELAVTYNARAIERRSKRRSRAGLFDEQDLPVFDRYLDAISATGVELRVVSRWVNGVSVVGTQAQFEQIAEFSFVRAVQPVRRGKKIVANEIQEPTGEALGATGVGRTGAAPFYGESEEQLDEMNLIAVHDLGFTGTGVVIGILDTGFQRSHAGFNDPTHPLNVIAEYDFIDLDNETGIEPGDPSDQHRHGTLILGTLGAYQPFGLVGAAYDASFILCKTEDTTGEYPAEEDNYVAGLEFIEQNGGDVATSSLRYTDWYTDADYDGLTAVTTIAVNTASANGLHCCTAAGNSGHDDDPETAHLGAPADAFQVITCGAVHDTGTIASFSSDGPTADGRVKPEVLARGVNTRTVDPSNNANYVGASGTSLSTPLVAGAVACLVEARPEWTVDELRNRLFETAGYFTENGTFDPNYVYGYGIIDALAALAMADCNGNGIIDSTDIANGTSADNDGNGVPDECECPAVSDRPEPESPVVAKGRYLTLIPANAGQSTALRVMPIDLPTAFETLEGTHFWVGAPREISERPGESDDEPPTFMGAPLSCDPVYLDWGDLGVLHIYDDVIVPDAQYEVRAINEACFVEAEGNYSADLTVATARWGDLVGDCADTPCSPPQGIPDFDDISALVDKFRDLPGAPAKARSDVVPGAVDFKVDFEDIPAVVDAFRGLPYPYAIPELCP